MSLIPIEKQTLEGKQAFLRKNCLHIAKNILLLSREKNFRKLIYSEVEKNFDTESYVLIDALVNSPYQDILKQMGIEVVCNKFKNLDGQDWYPQIYIPNFKCQWSKNKTDRTQSDPLTIVVFDGNESAASLPGYQLDANGNLFQLAQLIDENYANENEVWVIGLNENTTYSGSNPPPTSLSEINPKFDKMTIKEHKESWAAGRSDVSIISFSLFNNISMPNRDTTRYRVKDECIKQFTRAEIRNQTQIELNYVYFPRWNPMRINPPGVVMPTGDVYVFVIYEKDAWPVGMQSVNIATNSGRNNYIGYRSSDGCYISDPMPFSQAGSYNIENGGIKFNCKL